MKKTKHILVTGGAGFIGSHLVERLLNDGKTIVVIDDFSTGSLKNLQAVKKNPRLKIIPSKISDCAGLPELAKKSEFIFHLAATVGVDLVVKSALHVLEISFQETQILLRAAAKNSTPLLLTSTSEVYGKSAKPEFSEDDDLLIGPPGQSRWSYACSKLTDEFLSLAYAREKNLPVTIARLFNTVGPRQTGRYGMVLPRFIAAANANEPLRVFGDGAQSRCFCLVNDAVESLVRLQNCGKARGEIFNIGGTEEVSILELAKLVVKTLDSKSKIELIPYDKAYAPGFDDMRRRKPLVEKLERFVKFKPQTPLREIIRLTAE
ncbi:MAG TPA: NAD-dependent epimerase/dehydratase family protein [Candidatus Dormibacteraeota bacterium]|jgi:UDP-glucose 4-epimerase|nr:NAD-dependent epimerase/dehydratase family protein [Candidatus Dormibacteraeota bacterium]